MLVDNAGRDEPKSFNDWPNSIGFTTTYCEPTPVELTVKGHIPSWAAGTLYRTGTGSSELETKQGSKLFRVHHWFDGFAVMHRFQIIASDNPEDSVKVVYNSRSTCDGLIEKIRRTGKLEGMTFAAKYEPCTSYFRKFMSAFVPNRSEGSKSKPNEVTISVTMSTNFPGLTSTGQKQSHGHSSGIHTLCSKTDYNAFQMLDPETLEPIGLASQEVLHPELKGPLSCAHAKSDPVSGDVFNYNLEIALRSTYRVFRVSAATGETSILATISADAAYIHSFFLTEHYVVLCVWNSFYKANGLVIPLNQNIIDSIADFDPSQPAKWYVIDRRSAPEGGQGVVAIYESDAFFSFHTVNAFEEVRNAESKPAGSEATVDIVADLVTYPNIDIIKRFYLPNLLSTSPAAAALADCSNTATRPQLKRFRLASIPLPSAPTPASSPNNKRKVSRASLELTSKLFDAPELPTINPRYALRPYRYVYGVTDTGKSTLYDGLVKYDILTGQTRTWSQHGQSAGEAIFIPRRAGSPTRTHDGSVAGQGENGGEGSDEDDGVLLSVVLDGPAGRSYLLCLDAKTMTEMGRAELNGPVGFGFHGTHVRSGGGVGVGGPDGRGFDY